MATPSVAQPPGIGKALPAPRGGQALPVASKPMSGVGGGVVSSKKPDMAASMKRMMRRK